MVQILFPISVPESLSTEYASEYLQRQGYKRIASREGDTVYVVQDRIQPTSQNRSRMIEAIEVSLNRGNGFCLVQQLDEHRQGVGIRQEFTDKLRCSDCNVDYSDPLPNLFSFNSPIGACEMCRGFGRVIGIDYGQVIPNESLTLREGVIRAFNSPVYSESYRDILNYGEKSQNSIGHSVESVKFGTQALGYSRRGRLVQLKSGMAYNGSSTGWNSESTRCMCECFCLTTEPIQSAQTVVSEAKTGIA